MCHLPIEIDDDEKIVRAILCPAHVKPGSKDIRHQAFRSRPGTDEVSVIRHSYMGSDFCKRKGKEIEAGWPKNAFVGLAVTLASAIRNSGSSVHDSREEYFGHAHISHGFILPANEPPPPELNLKLTDRCKTILSSVTYHADPNPSSAGWTGPTF